MSCCGFRCRDRFHGAPAAKEHRQPLVHQQQNAAVAFFGEDADVRAAEPRRRRPVDRACVVAFDVMAKLFEIKPSPTQA